MVVSEMVKESTEDTEVMFVAEASEGESVTVYFSENTQFEHKTVKNKRLFYFFFQHYFFLPPCFPYSFGTLKFTIEKSLILQFILSGQSLRNL